MLTFICYPKCSTCQKAQANLQYTKADDALLEAALSREFSEF